MNSKEQPPSASGNRGIWKANRTNRLHPRRGDEPRRQTHWRRECQGQGSKQAAPRVPTQAHRAWLRGVQAGDTYSGDSMPQLTCIACKGCRRAKGSTYATFLIAGLGADGQSATENESHVVPHPNGVKRCKRELCALKSLCHGHIPVPSQLTQYPLRACPEAGPLLGS